jgi:hypothetical protein
MLDTLETVFEFDDLNIVIGGKISTGCQFNGYAVLTEDGDGFYVSEITLSDGVRLSPPSIPPGGKHLSLEDLLFNSISDIIENHKTPAGKAAADAWRWAVSEAHDDGEIPAAAANHSTINHTQTGIRSAVAVVR